MSISALSDQLYLDLKIDDRDLPQDMINFLEEAYVIENIAGAPVFSLQVNDTVGLFSDIIPLTDSNKFSITMGTSISEVSDNQSFDFRYFSSKGTQYHEGFKYRINSIFDNYNFVKDIKQKAYKGTSDTVLKTIATDCGLDFISKINCDDEQVWLNFSDPLSVFVKKISKHASLKNGCPVSAIMANKDFIYKDIISAMNSDEDAVMSTIAEDGAIAIRELSPSSSAGFLNSWLNYGYTLVEDGLDGTSRQHTGISLSTTEGGAVAINTDISNVITSRIDYVPQDCGNCHPKYWEAYHNNLRILGLFSKKMVVLVDSVTNLSLLDTVRLKVYSASGTLNGYSGKYVIVAKKTLIRGTKYAEIFEMYRATITEQGNANLTTEAPPVGTYGATASASTDIPDKETLVSGSPVSTTQLVQPAEVATLPTIDQVLPTTNTATTVSVVSGTTQQGTFNVAVSNLGDRVA